LSYGKRWTQADIRDLQRKATTDADRKASRPEPKRSAPAPLESAREGKTRHPRKCLISIESRRVQLQDPDNGMEKWHVDALRYAGLISDDSTDEIEIRKWQTKVPHFAEECTVITLTEMPQISETEIAQIYSKTLNELKL
jgi:hypothetical protein